MFCAEIRIPLLQFLELHVGSYALSMVDVISRAVFPDAHNYRFETRVGKVDIFADVAVVLPLEFEDEVPRDVHRGRMGWDVILSKEVLSDRMSCLRDLATWFDLDALYRAMLLQGTSRCIGQSSKWGDLQDFPQPF